MVPLLKTWLPPIATCLMLQAVLVGSGLIVNQWLNPDSPCCTQDLVL